MMLLPKKIGSYTLTRRLGSDGVVEAFVAILDEPAGKQVVVKRLLPWVTRDSTRLADTEGRIGDLTGHRHPLLVAVLDYVKVEDEHLIVEDVHEGVSLRAAIQWCKDNKKPIPHSIFLHWATQICNGLEALHGRPGKATGAEHVLHLGLDPSSISLGADGRVVLGGYSYHRSPAIPAGEADPNPADLALLAQNPPRLDHLSPEQTYADQKLAPSSDLFSLGSTLFELLTTESMFEADSLIQTLHKVRRAEVAGPLARSKDLLPGLDKILYRALSLNPRHRYQRAFVLREDLRGLMAGFSFARIGDDIQQFLAPLVEQRSRPESRVGNTITPVDETPLPLGLDGGSEDTAALIRRAHDKRDPESQPATPVSPIAPPEVKQSSHTWYDESGENTAPLPDPESVEEVTNTTWIRNPKLDPGQTLTPEPAAPANTLVPEPAQAVQLPVAPEEMPPPAEAKKEEPSPPPKKEEPPPSHATARMAVTELAPHATARMPLPTPDPKPSSTARMPLPQASSAEEEEPPPSGGGMGWLIGAVIAGGVVVIALVVCAGGGMAGLQSLLGGSASESGTPAAVDADPKEPAPKTAEPAEAPAPDVAVEPASKATPPAEPAAKIEPQPEAVAKVESRPEPVAKVEPKPEPVAKTEPRPSKTEHTAKVDPRPQPEERSPVVIEERPKAKVEPKSSSGSSSIAIVTPPVAAAEKPAKSAKSIPIQVFDIQPPEVQPATDAVMVVEPTLGPLADYSDRAFKGGLSDSDRKLLEGVDKGSADYSRASVLLYQDAKARGDGGGRKRYLDSLMAIPENQYNPALLSEQGQLAIERKDWKTAVSKAEVAERHWQRLPSELIFSRKAMIYEIQAAGWQGVFYDSGGSDLPALHASIRAWEKYQRHVSAKADLAAKAEDELTKLYDVQRRLE